MAIALQSASGALGIRSHRLYGAHVARTGRTGVGSLDHCSKLRNATFPSMIHFDRGIVKLRCAALWSAAAPVTRSVVRPCSEDVPRNRSTSKSAKTSAVCSGVYLPFARHHHGIQFSAPNINLTAMFV